MNCRKALAGGLLLILPLALLGGSAAAATLEDLELGDHWMGEKWDKESLRDRTVVIEFWGYN
ncbi:MAG: hypothetical protein ACYTHM_17570 [Planctomycetota bacterium]